MPRYVFTSFHFSNDFWRAQTVRNIGAISGNRFASPNDWEEIKRQGDDAIRSWINDNMKGKSCNVVLIGASTASRRWVKYEIRKAWDDKKGLLGIHIHKLKDSNSNQSTKGRNPFEDFTVNGTQLSSIVKAYDPPQATSSGVYQYIADNIEDWIERAIEIRNAY